MEIAKVQIIINAEVDETGKILTASTATEKMVSGLMGAIANSSEQPIEVQVVAAATLGKKPQHKHELQVVYCPLTIQLPEFFEFSRKKIYQACKDIQGMRRWVARHLRCATGKDQAWLGDHWLPVVLTQKGPLYGEVIGEGIIPNSYQQPIDLTDDLRQPLYDLAYRTLHSLSAPPAVYLLQFSLHNQELIFDRLWPFPAAPAIASVAVQQPDLFTCHWHCLIDQPILDLTIVPRD